MASQAGRGESRKIDQIIHTMEQYNIKIGALQETKWFGSNAYWVAGVVVHTAIRSIPPSNKSRKSDEEVSVVLLGMLFTVGKLQGNNGKLEIVEC